MALACFEEWLNPNGISLEEARRFDEFPLYWLGETYDGYDLNEINSWGSEPGDEYYTEPGVTITYGEETCAENSSNCLTPIWIDIEPYCQSSPEETLAWLEHLLTLPEYGDYTISEAEVRGVKAYRFGESRTYLWTASSAIIVDANTADLRTMQVAEDLIPISEDSDTTQEPPPPPVSTSCPETPGA